MDTTRIDKIIKEVLSNPIKESKGCSCGCGKCKSAVVLKESKISTLLSEGLRYHIDNKIPLHESEYRIGSEAHLSLIREARKLYSRNLIDVSDSDKFIIESDLGNFGEYEGEMIPLDLPMLNEEDSEEYSKYLDLYSKILKAIDEVDENLSYKELSSAVAKIIKDQYGSHNIKPFMDDLQGKLGSNINEAEYKGKDVDLDLPMLEQTYSGFMRGEPEDPDSEPFEPTGTVSQFREELRALFGKFKGDLKNPDFIKGVAQIMVNWKSLLRSQLDESKKKEVNEADYQGRNVDLNKPSRSSGPKKYKVYVKNDKGNVIKVNFGDVKGGLKSKINDSEARKAFADRHNCKTKKDKTKAGYWSCNLPKYAKALGLGANMNTFW